VQASTVWKEIPLSLFAILVLFVLTNFQLYETDAFLLGRMDAIILLLFFGAFLCYVYKQLSHENSEISAADDRALWKHWLIVMIGLAGLVIGGRLVVINAVKIAEVLGLSEKVIGLTIVAAGTSLPELATSVVAAVKKNNDIAVGNIIGSNIFNLFFILGVSAMVRPFAFNPSFNIDLAILSVGTLFLFVAMFLSGKQKLDRWEAFVLLIGYVAYTIWLI
jgi:cation:H+ antiporter